MTKAIVTRLSMNELTGRILDMAQTGVYRESLFETFRPMATKKQVKSAIALAKQFGLQSDPALRDADLGTYYQADAQKVQSYQSIIDSSLMLQAGDDMAQRMQLAMRTVKMMLVVSGAVRSRYSQSAAAMYSVEKQKPPPCGGRALYAWAASGYGKKQLPSRCSNPALNSETEN